ncbi:MAG: ParB/RepB/Spo0J family partition protein, partial [Pseudomonadota bacterium]
MTKQQKISPDAAIQHVPLANLYVSDLNPRRTVSEAHIESLADSIERFGLIHNLAGVLDADGKVGIVAGGCRLRAIQIIAERSKDHPFATVPVKLPADAAEAEDWASAENAAREDMTPADEIRAFGRMKARGATVPEIALAFAVTETRVYQRLALAGLPEPVLDALAAGEISLGTAKAFTLSQDEALTLGILGQVKGQAVSESAIKAALQPDAIKATDRRARFVGVEAYEAEGGAVTRDLFSDEVFLASPALLDRLFEEKLEAARAAVVAQDGWAWAEVRHEAWLNYYDLDQMKLARLYAVEGELSEDEAEEYDELAELSNGGVLDAGGEARLAELQAILDGDYAEDQKAHAGCIILVNSAGQIEVTAGLVRAEDKTAAIEAGVLQAPTTTKPDTPKSPYSQKLVADMQAIRLAAVQAALLAKPELVLDLLGFGLSEASGSFESIFGLRLDRPSNVPSV